MSLASGRLALALLTLSCALHPVTPPAISPEALQANAGDSAALASLDSFVVASLSRPNCPMPVLRGDSSHDTLMVLKLGPRKADALPPRLAPCYNPLFR